MKFGETTNLHAVVMNFDICMEDKKITKLETRVFDATGNIKIIFYKNKVNKHLIHF